MGKHRYTFNCDLDVMALIDEAARQNNTSRSAVARLLLELVRVIPAEKLKQTSPVPAYFGIQNTGDKNECR